MSYWEWFKAEIKSITILIWFVLFVTSTVLAVMGKIDGYTWAGAQAGFAGIAMWKRAETQKIVAGQEKG